MSFCLSSFTNITFYPCTYLTETMTLLWIFLLHYQNVPQLGKDLPFSLLPPLIPFNGVLLPIYLKCVQVIPLSPLRFSSASFSVPRDPLVCNPGPSLCVNAAYMTSPVPFKSSGLGLHAYNMIFGARSCVSVTISFTNIQNTVLYCSLGNLEPGLLSFS